MKIKGRRSDCVANNLNTTDLTGEMEDRHFVITRGDSRIAMIIARNPDTLKFNRESRFLVDDPDSPHKLAYLLTKPLKRGHVFGEDGVLKFVLQEVTATKYDNHELGIADYYKHFPKEDTDGSGSIADSSDTEQADAPAKKRGWL